MNGDALDDEHLFLEHHLADCLDLIALRIDIDVARFQRAGEGAGQSAASGSHHVVQRRCVRGVLVGADAVVLSDLGMNAKRHRLMFGWQVREPLRATQPLDPHTGHVCGLGRHGRGGYYRGRPRSGPDSAAASRESVGAGVWGSGLNVRRVSMIEPRFAGTSGGLGAPSPSVQESPVADTMARAQLGGHPVASGGAHYRSARHAVAAPRRHLW